MAKVRFPLEMADGSKIGDLDTLKEHFDLPSVLTYYKNGKLLTWLQDRYMEGEAEAVANLNESAPDFQQRLCEIFGVEFQGEQDLEAIERRQERLEKLRQFTDDDEIIRRLDQVAFNQEELAALLDVGIDTIYLCGGKFVVPASQKGKTYIGLKQPQVQISRKLPDTEAGLRISFEGCKMTEQTSRRKNMLTSETKIKARTMEDSFPFFKSILELRDSNEVTKYFLLVSNHSVDYKDAPHALSYVERYFAQKGGLHIPYIPLNEEELKELRINSLGMPEGSFMSWNDILIGNVILNIKLSQEGQWEFKHLKMVVSNAYAKYMSGLSCIKKLKDGTFKFNDASYRELMRVRKSGWYDDIPEPSKEELEFAEKYNEKQCALIPGYKSEKVLQKELEEEAKRSIIK